MDVRETLEEQVEATLRALLSEATTFNGRSDHLSSLIDSVNNVRATLSYEAFRDEQAKELR